MVNKQEKSWKKDFKIWIQPFANGEILSDIEKNSIEMITSKVENILSHQQEELIRKIEGLKQDVLYHRPSQDTKIYNMRAYNKALEEVINLIKEQSNGK